MALQLSRAVSDGIERTLTRAGGIVLVGIVLVQFGIQLGINSVIVAVTPPEAAEQITNNIGLVLPIPAGVAFAFALVSLVISAAFFVIVARVFTQPRSEMSGFPADATRRLVRASLITLIGGVIVAFAVMFGLLFFIVPGVFFAISFLFFIFAVGVEDRGIIGSLKRSWALARGSRLKIGLLALISALFGGAVGVVGVLLELAAGPLVSEIVLIVFSAVFFVPYYAILGAAYLQLRGDQDGSDQPATEPLNASQAAEL